ncbi:MAG: EAL domain-containing protein [Aquihabitans sp.]
MTGAPPPPDPTESAADTTEIAASERRVNKLLNSARDIVSLVDIDGRILFTTASQVGALGYHQEWADISPFSIVHPDDQERAGASWLEAMRRPGEAVETEVRMRMASDEWADLVITGVNLFDDPDVGGMVMTARNVTDLRQAERLASSQAAVLELIARGASVTEVFERCVELVEDNGVGGQSSIYLLDGDELQIRAGRAPSVLTEAVRYGPRHEGRSVCDRAIKFGRAEVIPDLTQIPDGEFVDELVAVISGLGLGAAWSQPIRSVPSGETIGSMSTIYDRPHVPTAHERQVAEVACSLVSIAVEHQETQARLAHQAMHDSLTGLPNRTLLLDRLNHALARRERARTDVAVLFCDLDRFKVVNDSLGHGIGDHLLVSTADRLQAMLEPGDTVARFGGDEFVVLLEDVVDDGYPEEVGGQIAKAMEAPFFLPSGQEVYLTTSIGLALSSDHRSGEGWLRDADAAMYRAKEQGRNRLVVFDSDMREAAVIRMEVEHDLHRAVERNELVMHYQPVIDLNTGRISGAEALVRWNHPTRGLMYPDEFIPVAEETGAIERVGRHVMEMAVRDMAGVIARRPIDDFILGVNLSARQVTNPALADEIAEVCRRNDWNPRQLLLEITETALTRDTDDSIDELEKVHGVGVHFAIDDFGTGYSSLTRLRHLPVDQVKVDRTFVAEIDQPDRQRQADGHAPRIVDAVIALAAALDLGTCAEGVETDAQLAYLRTIGCSLAQGFLFSKPLPIDEFEDLLTTDPHW